MNVSISILTGRRLPLLRRTIESVYAAAPTLLSGSYVVAYLNGRDDDTDAYLRSVAFIDDYVYAPTAQPEPIGDAVSRLAARVSGWSAYHVHLEDDWSCSAKSSDFVDDAISFLDGHPDVGQVRLRRRSERVMRTHLVTGSGATWVKSGSGFWVSKLHYTFNPSLMRTKDFVALYPASSEVEAALNYSKQFKYVAQADPGVFAHTGGSSSLRQKMGR